MRYSESIVQSKISQIAGFSQNLRFWSLPQKKTFEIRRLPLLHHKFTAEMPLVTPENDRASSLARPRHLARPASSSLDPAAATSELGFRGRRRPGSRRCRRPGSSAAALSLRRHSAPPPPPSPTAATSPLGPSAVPLPPPPLRPPAARARRRRTSKATGSPRE
jgi:hypothetical protein